MDSRTELTAFDPQTRPLLVSAFATSSSLDVLPEELLDLVMDYAAANSRENDQHPQMLFELSRVSRKFRRVTARYLYRSLSLTIPSRPTVFEGEKWQYTDVLPSWKATRELLRRLTANPELAKHTRVLAVEQSISPVTPFDKGGERPSDFKDLYAVLCRFNNITELDLSRGSSDCAASLVLIGRKFTKLKKLDIDMTETYIHKIWPLFSLVHLESLCINNPPYPQSATKPKPILAEDVAEWELRRGKSPLKKLSFTNLRINCQVTMYELELLAQACTALKSLKFQGLEAHHHLTSRKMLYLFAPLLLKGTLRHLEMWSDCEPPPNAVQLYDRKAEAFFKHRLAETKLEHLRLRTEVLTDFCPPGESPHFYPPHIEISLPITMRHLWLGQCGYTDKVIFQVFHHVGSEVHNGHLHLLRTATASTYMHKHEWFCTECDIKGLCTNWQWQTML